MVPDRCDVTGPAAGAAVAHGPQPGLDVRADAGSQAVELAVQPAFEGRAPVIVEHAHLLEDLGDPRGADAQGPLYRDDLGVPDSVAGLVPGQHDDQRAADPEPHSPPPAAGLAAAPGQVEPPGQPRVARVGAGALIEPGEVPAGLEQPALDPAAGRLGDQQLPHPAAQHGADDVQVGQLDAGRAARPQPGHLPGADRQARLGEHPLQLAGLPDAAVGGRQAQVPLHGPSPFRRSAARCWPAIQASSIWVAWT